MHYLDEISCLQELTWLRRLAAGLYIRRSGFDVYVRFVVGKATVRRVFLLVLRFHLLASFNRRSKPIFSLELILSVEQAVEFSELLNEATIFHDLRLRSRSSCEMRSSEVE